MEGREMWKYLQYLSLVWENLKQKESHIEESEESLRRNFSSMKNWNELASYTASQQCATLPITLSLIHVYIPNEAFRNIDCANKIDTAYQLQISLANFYC